jgi:hypothetical protein
MRGDFDFAGTFPVVQLAYHSVFVPGPETLPGGAVGPGSLTLLYG